MRTLLASGLVVTLLLAMACGYVEEVETEDIVAGIPWPDEEQSQYVLLDRDGEELARGSLSVSRVGDEFEFSIDFTNDDGTDEATVRVDATTLKPSTVRRERDLEGEQSLVEGTYDPVEEIVEVVEIENGDRRQIPARLEPNYYDNESSLFLWRTIIFEEGYEASYNSVLVNQGGATHLVSLRVDGQQEVTVPAGTFQTWRVQIRTNDVRQTVWYSDTPEHLLVQYDNSQQIFQLTDASSLGS